MAFDRPAYMKARDKRLRKEGKCVACMASSATRLCKECKEKRRQYLRQYRQTPAGKAKLAAAEDRRKDSRKVSRAQYIARRRREDPWYAPMRRIQTRTGFFVGLIARPDATIYEFGCSLPELKKHLQKQFRPGMTWKNYGRGKGMWNVDHIRPLSAFDLTDPQERQKASHYSNLQPLWFEDNVRKGGVSRKQNTEADRVSNEALDRPRLAA